MFRSFSVKAFAAALVILVTGQAFGGADAQVTNPTATYTSVTSSVALSVLAELGYQTSVSQAEGLIFITATRGTQTPLIMSVASCADPVAPNCRLLVMMGFAPIAILGGGSAEKQLTTLAAVNALEDFSIVKFAILDPTMLSAMRTELYFFGGTRGNIAYSIEMTAMINDQAFKTLTSMANTTSLVPQAFNAPGGGATEVTFSALSTASELMTSTPSISTEQTPQTQAASKAIDLIMTLMKAKSFRQEILIDE